MLDRFIVMRSSCSSPAGKRWRGYVNLAIVELTPEAKRDELWPKMISERARGVRRIVEYHHSVYLGSRGRGRELLNRLRQITDNLNNSRSVR